METKFIASTQKTGKEAFNIEGIASGISLAAYWSWAHSDLVNNTERGKLAEFIVASALGVIGNTGTYDNNRKRQSEVYVFCFLKHLDKLTLNPLDLNQWEFYTVPTSLLDKLVPTQKNIALSFFSKNSIKPCRYTEIRSRVERAIEAIPT